MSTGKQGRLYGMVVGTLGMVYRWSPTENSSAIAWLQGCLSCASLARLAARLGLPARTCGILQHAVPFGSPGRRAGVVFAVPGREHCQHHLHHGGDLRVRTSSSARLCPSVGTTATTPQRYECRRSGRRIRLQHHAAHGPRPRGLCALRRAHLRRRAHEGAGAGAGATRRRCGSRRAGAPRHA